MTLWGLFPKLKANRPLSDNERYGKLDQIHWQQEPFTDLVFNGYKSVIRLNSTYLETADRHYIWKGLGMLLLVVMFVMTLSLLISLPFALKSRGFEKEGVLALLIIFIMFSPFVWFLLYMLLTEFFRWTHYPVRFNRKTRQVYVFGYDGIIRQAHWNDIFFTVRTDIKGVFKDNFIFAHLLAEDKKTVMYSFILPVETPRRGSTEGLQQYWNFLCNYMNGDIEDNAAVMRVCPPIEERKEGFTYGIYHCCKMLGEIWPVLLITFPLALAMGIVRYFVMLTCKVPKWSDEVKAACVIAPDDPINLSAATNPQSLLSTFRIDSKEERDANMARRKALQAKIHAIVRQRKSRRQRHSSRNIEDLI